MNRFKNILLVLRETHNERGIERAVHLAKKNNAQLTLLKPTGTLIRSLDVFKGMEPFSRLQSAVLSKNRDELTKLCDSLASSNVTAKIETPTGSPSVAIIKQVLRNQHDLVITTAQGSTGPMGTLFRSLSLHLIRKCPCPVWVVHPEKPRRVGQVLAAVDPTVSNNGDSTVNSLIMDLSISLSQMDNAKLHIVYAYHTLELEGFESLLADHGGITSIPKEDHQACVEKAINKRKNHLKELLFQHALHSVEHQTHFLEGPPSKVIPEAANKHEVDVIVLGAITHTKHAGHCIGTTAENIIQQIGCSVLALKPPGFVSPVEL